MLLFFFLYFIFFLLSLNKKNNFVMQQQNKFFGYKPNLKWFTYPETILNDHPRYKLIENPILTWDDNHNKISRDLYSRVKQRTQAWFDLRAHEKNVIFGSSIMKYVGFDCEQAKKLFDPEKVKYASNNSFKTVIHRTKPEEFSPESKVYMEWGSIHETNAALTLINYKDKLTFTEAGCYVKSLKEVANGKFRERVINEQLNPELLNLEFGASPDGFFIDKEININGTVELKCKTPFLKYPDKSKGNKICYRYQKPHAPNKIPEIYLLQVQLQMLLTNSMDSYFLTWTPYIVSKKPTKNDSDNGGSFLIHSKRDDDYLMEAFKLIVWAKEKWGKVDYIPPNPFASCIGYSRFLMRTKELCENFVSCEFIKGNAYENQLKRGQFFDDIDDEPIKSTRIESSMNPFLLTKEDEDFLLGKEEDKNITTIKQRPIDSYFVNSLIKVKEDVEFINPIINNNDAIKGEEEFIKMFVNAPINNNDNIVKEEEEFITITYDDTNKKRKIIKQNDIIVINSDDDDKTSENF